MLGKGVFIEKKAPIPRELTGKGRGYFKLATEGTFDEVELRLLEKTCKFSTVADDCLNVIREQVALYESVKGLKQRPKVALLRDSWNGFLAGVKALGFDASKEKPKKEIGRPPENLRTVQTRRQL